MRRSSPAENRVHRLPDIDIDIDIDNGHHGQSDFICLPNALHSSIGQTIIAVRKFVLPAGTLTENMQTIEVNPTNKQKMKQKRYDMTIVNINNHRIYKDSDRKVAHGAVTVIVSYRIVSYRVLKTQA